MLWLEYINGNNLGWNEEKISKEIQINKTDPAVLQQKEQADTVLEQTKEHKTTQRQALEVAVLQTQKLKAFALALSPHTSCMSAFNVQYVAKSKAGCGLVSKFIRAAVPFGNFLEIAFWLDTWSWSVLWNNEDCIFHCWCSWSSTWLL